MAKFEQIGGPFSFNHFQYGDQRVGVLGRGVVHFHYINQEKEERDETLIRPEVSELPREIH